MTDEQIKLNAEAYADKKAETVANFQRNPVVEDFIAGAHSRDEEIIELLEKYTYKIDSLIAQKEDLQAECDQLRNPWISAEERLPDIDPTQHTNKKNFSIAVLAHDINILHDCLGQAYSPSVVRYDYERKDWLYVELGCYANEVGVGAEITHWMPIPEIKK